MVKKVPSAVVVKFSTNLENFHQNGDQFLDGSTHLYKRGCPLVGPSVRKSVRRSVTSSVTSFFYVKNEGFSSQKSLGGWVKI